jgi:hypothetical protein
VATAGRTAATCPVGSAATGADGSTDDWTVQTVRAAHALGYVDGRHRGRLGRLLGFLVDQREDAVASLPTGPAQLVPLRHVTVVQRVVVGSPPPPPRLRSGIRDRDLPRGGAQPGDQLDSVGRGTSRFVGVFFQPFLCCRYLARVLAVLEVVAAVCRDDRDGWPAAAPRSLDQSALLKRRSRMDGLWRENHGLVRVRA